MRPKAIERVRNTHQPSLGFDPRYSLLGGKMGRDLFREEEANDLSATGQYLLTDYDGERSDAL